MSKTLIDGKRFTLSWYYAGRGGKRFQITQNYKNPFPEDSTACRFSGYVSLSEEDLWDIVYAVENERDE